MSMTATGPVPAIGLLPPIRLERQAALSGFLATAVTFGPARMAFGMFLPDIRAEFGLSQSGAGAIVSSSFVAFLVGLLVTSFVTRRYGAKLPVLLGCALAALGCLAVAGASATGMLAVGVVAATMAGGFTWTPFNAVTERTVRRPRRDRVLSTVSTGTTFGVLGMAAAALCAAGTGFEWREAWLAFGGSAFVAGFAAWLLLPPSARLRPRAAETVPPLALRDLSARLLRPAAAPLFAASLVFGMVSAVFAAFAVDHAASLAKGSVLSGEAGGPDAAWTGGVMYLAYGLAGALGLATAAIERRIGLRALTVACFATSAVSLGILAVPTGGWFAGSHWLALVVSAATFGAVVMVFCVVLAIWSMRIFPRLPVAGFTAAIIAMSVGSVAGPLGAGVLADMAGTWTVFVTGAALSALVAAGTLMTRIRAA